MCHIAVAAPFVFHSKVVTKNRRKLEVRENCNRFQLTNSWRRRRRRRPTPKKRSAVNYANTDDVQLMGPFWRKMILTPNYSCSFYLVISVAGCAEIFIWVTFHDFGRYWTHVVVHDGELHKWEEHKHWAWGHPNINGFNVGYWRQWLLWLCILCGCNK